MKEKSSPPRRTKKHTIMCEFDSCCGAYAWLIPVIIFLVAWETVWKLIAFWKSARNNHLVWFVCIALINTAGILPIIYILTHKKKSESEKAKEEPKV